MKMGKKRKLSDKCPYCGKIMKKGYLRGLGSLWGWGWAEEKKPWTMGGRCIAGAYTCQHCKIIILSSDLKDLDRGPTETESKIKEHSLHL